MTEMEVMQFLNRGLRLQPSAQGLIYLRDSSFLRYLLWAVGLGRHRRPDRLSAMSLLPIVRVEEGELEETGLRGLAFAAPDQP